MGQNLIYLVELNYQNIWKNYERELGLYVVLCMACNVYVVFTPYKLTHCYTSLNTQCSILKKIICLMDFLFIWHRLLWIHVIQTCWVYSPLQIWSISSRPTSPSSWNLWILPDTSSDCEVTWHRWCDVMPLYLVRFIV